jgi:DNA-binding NtrC family response regulator
MKILVVDDEDIVLSSCRRVLGSEGYEIVSVKSAKDALEAMEKTPFYLLLIDIKMPEKDGIYLIKEIRNRWKDIPIIVMSGYSTSEIMAHTAKMGAAAFISKPFTPDELVETVRSVSERSEDNG